MHPEMSVGLKATRFLLGSPVVCLLDIDFRSFKYRHRSLHGYKISYLLFYDIFLYFRMPCSSTKENVNMFSSPTVSIITYNQSFFRGPSLLTNMSLSSSTHYRTLSCFLTYLPRNIHRHVHTAQSGRKSEKAYFSNYGGGGPQTTI